MMSGQRRLEAHSCATELHGVDEVPRGGSTRHATAMDVEDSAAKPLTARHFPSIFYPLQSDDWPSLSSYYIVSSILQRLTEPLKF